MNKLRGSYAVSSSQCRTLWMPTVLAALAGASCSPEPSDSVAQPLLNQMFGASPNHAEFTLNANDSNPSLARASYAIPQLWAPLTSNGCSAAMIGPNILMSAAHCGGNSNPGWRAAFRTTQSSGTINNEIFNCTWILQNLGDSDVSLFFCGPNAAGESPGDKYGYLDFDTSTVQLNQSVVTLWRNAFPSADGTTIPIGSVLYSRGNVIDGGGGSVTGSILGSGYPSPVSGPPSRVVVRRYGEQGQSGSVTLNAANYRILIGPTSNGNVDANGINATFMNSVPMRQYFAYARLPYMGLPLPPLLIPGWPSPPSFPALTLNTSFVGTFRPDPWAYYDQRMDQNDNQIWDVQELIENSVGESARRSYWLNFDSARRNRLWETFAATSFDTQNQWVRSTSSTNGWNVMMQNRHLNLARGATYSIRFLQWTASAGGASMYVGFSDPTAGWLYPTTSNYYPTAAGQGWVTRNVTINVPANATGPSLVFGAFQPVDMFVTNLQVVRHDFPGRVTNNFDSAGQRHPWRSESTAAAITVLDGNGTQPNWAGKVRYDYGISGGGLSLTNDNLPVQGGRAALICFQARRTGEPLSSQARVTIVTGAGTVVTSDFSPGLFYNQYCINVPASSIPTDMLSLRFGYQPTAAYFTPHQTGAYLIDDVSVSQ